MSRFDFDEVVDRSDTNSVKWNYSEKYTGRKDLLPLWVADMDFRAPAAVLKAIEDRVAHGVFGYATYPPSYFQAVREWMEKRHRWQVAEEWIVPIPGVVPTIRIALEAYTRPGDKVIIQPPVYHPFRRVIARNGRQVLQNPLRRSAARYEMDFDQLEGIIDEDTRLFLLCSPHNPVGRVWRREELERLIAICEEHRIILLSDEIHSDIVMPGNTHLPVGNLYGGRRNSSVTLTSATKTFNLSGISCASAIVPDPEHRRALKHQLGVESLEIPNVLALVATETAYRSGAAWLDALLSYLQDNYLFATGYLREHAPSLTVFPLEGTYLMWIDFREAGIPDEELKRRLLEAGVWLDEGPIFGDGGEGFQRVNIACPRSTLEAGLEKICRAITP